MKFAIFALFCVGLAFGDDNQCHKPLTDVHDCVKKKHEQNKAADDAVVEKAKSDVGNCFTKVGCDAPDYDGNSGFPGKIKQEWDDQPEAVKECIKKDFKLAALKKLNECLAKNGVKQIQDSEMDDHDVFGDRNTADGDALAKTLIAVVMAVKKCQKDHSDKSKEVLSCMEPIKDKIKSDMCKRVSDCKVEVKVSDTCNKRGQEIKQAICKCKVDKMKEALTKIEELQKRSGDVTVDDIKDVHDGEMGAGGIKDIDVDKIEKCYKDNGVTPPATLGVAKTLLAGGNGGGLLGLFKQQKPKITQAQLQDMHDGLQQKINHPDCGC